MEKERINPELNKRVYISDIKEAFHLKQVTGNEESLKRWAIAPDINRPGLELSGYKGEQELKRVVVIGIKEMTYIETLDYNTQLDRFNFLTDSYTPCIILSGGMNTPKSLIEVANQKNFPVFEFPGKTYMLTTELTSYLSEQLSPIETVNGEMLNIYGKGVMILGKSGMGKSELALDLIRRGHMLVADDVVEYSRIHNSIYCRSPKNLKQMIEVRGLGVLDITLMFGAQSFLEKSKLDFVIRLVTLDEYKNGDNKRLVPTEKVINLAGLDLLVLEIPVTEGKTMAPIVEASVIDHILKNRGIDSNEKFKENIRKDIIEKNKESN